MLVVVRSRTLALPSQVPPHTHVKDSTIDSSSNFVTSGSQCGRPTEPRASRTRPVVSSRDLRHGNVVNLSLNSVSQATWSRVKLPKTRWHLPCLVAHSLVSRVLAESRWSRTKSHDCQVGIIRSPVIVGRPCGQPPFRITPHHATHEHNTRGRDTCHCCFYRLDPCE